MQLGTHIKIWIIGSIFSVFAVGLMSKPETVYEVVNKDVEQVRMAFGDDIGSRVIGNANSAFGIFFGAASPAAKEMHVTSDMASRGVFGFEKNASSISNKMIRAMRLELYHLLLRLNIVFAWLPMILVLCGAALVDGMCTRKIKMFSFGYANPVLYNTSSHLAIFAAGLMLMLLHLPINVSIFFWPIAGSVIAVAILIASSNLQRLST